MFIIGVLNIIKIYQTRHPDINPQSAGTFTFLAAMIFITVIGVVCCYLNLLFKYLKLLIYSIMINYGFG
jgi:hypothetical protein